MLWSKPFGSARHQSIASSAENEKETRLPHVPGTIWKPPAQAEDPGEGLGCPCRKRAGPASTLQLVVLPPDSPSISTPSMGGRGLAYAAPHLAPNVGTVHTSLAQAES